MEFIDLKKQYALIEKSVRKRISAVLEHANFIMGPEVKELEEKLSRYVGTRHCLTCASGTDALLLALMAKNVGPGDAIFTTPFSFIATAEVITLLGATPVFVDIDERTYNIDPIQLEATIESLSKGHVPSPGTPSNLKPRGIIPVDLFGLPADYDAINNIAHKYGLFVLEDAAQSFGAEYKGGKACSLAEIAAASFFPAKPLGCYGDGGALFIDDDSLFEILSSLRVHGKGADKYDNVRIGINGRLDTLQAAILLEKMEIFPGEIEKRQRIASRYIDGLRNIIQTPIIPSGYSSAWAQFTVSTERRTDLLNRLKEKNIPTAVYYPKPLHLQTAFGFLHYGKGSLPVSEKASQEVFSLPMSPYLEEKDQDSVIETISGCFIKKG
ncbi:MAG: DegT/DnrJ/EryC1/StrS family aminotransferase [Chitinispirillaceae bacterium]|nr:DegT/DnrJ/EryC1/StrS family aminotransferase [Chitinispirillaceae bacterium]